MHIVLVFLLLCVECSYAEDISLIETNKKIKPIMAKQEEASPKQEVEHKEMDEYLNEEEEKIKAIKLLNLDLEKASLELKKKEIQSKMLALNHAAVMPDNSTLAGDGKGNTPPILRVMGLTVNGLFKEAVIQVDGHSFTMREGQMFAQGITIKAIEADKVLVRYADGKENTIFFSGV